MIERIALYAPGGLGLPGNLFGKDVANLELFRAVARLGGLRSLDVLLHRQVPAGQVRTGLALDAAQPAVETGSVLSIGRMRAAGTVLRGKADLADLAWLRHEAGDERAFSLVGLVHCIAPPAMRRYIADSAVAPVQPWDALICTSAAVRDNLEAMLDDYSGYLASRFGAPPATPPRRPQLPVIPLGVDGEHYRALADRPAVRQAVRARLGLAADDVLVLWVGRLSFVEKAFPQPMMAAVERAARRSGRRIVFAMAGWFADPEADRLHYEETARLHAPSTEVRFVDGRDKAAVDGLWAAGDIFLSLVDNVQETFGLTPLEAMAAGLPVVVSDWDGYRDTVQDGVQGYLVRTLGGPAALGGLMLRRHLAGFDAYQTYVGTVAQHTAVDVEAAAEALAQLAGDPGLRGRMGEAGRARIRAAYDWSVVVPQVMELCRELAERRAGEGFSTLTRQGADPVRQEPFSCFAGYAADTLRPDSVLQAGDVQGFDPDAPGGVLDRFGQAWRGTAAEAGAVLLQVGEGPCRLADVLARFPPERHAAVSASVMWLCKQGVLAWR